MGFTRQRKQSKFIINSNINIFTKIITTLFTMLMWLYCSIIIFLFISAILNYNNEFISIIKIALKVNNDGIRYFIFVSMLFFVSAFILLFLWRFYNKKRYGKLNRRKPPKPCTDSDMLNLNLMKMEDYFAVKNSNIYVFETNPIRDINDDCVERGV